MVSFLKDKLFYPLKMTTDTKLIEMLKNMTVTERLERTIWLDRESHPLATRLYVCLNHFTEPDYKLIETTLCDLADNPLFDRFVASICYRNT
jgi:hypothetical protein